MYLLHLLAFTLLLLPTVVWGATTAEEAAAQSFVPLVGIPYIEGEKVATFGDYVNAFYYASISIAAFLAVIRIIFAGVKYMLSDIVSSKQDAKKDIRSALFGLLIVVGAVLILNTINTNLTNIRLFADAPMPRMTGETGRVSIPSNTVTVGEDSAYNIQEFLGSCVDIVRTGDTMCCNDSNTCNTPEPPTNHDLTGYDPNKVYSTAEVVVLLTANSENPNVLDLGLGTSGQTADSLCTQAATIRNRSGADAYIVQQNTAQVGIRIVKERIVCVMH